MRKVPLVFSSFDAGIHVKRDPTAVPTNAVADALNMLWDDGAPAARRPGYARWTSTDITGRTIRTLYPWEQSNGTRSVLAGVRNPGGGGTNEVWQADDSGAFAGTAITGGTAFTTTYEMEFAQALSNVYMANGVEATQRYDGTAMQAAGVDGAGAGGSGAATQAAAPVAGAPAGGGTIPNATYKWAYTYVYGSRGESYVGQASGTQSPNNQQVGLTNVTVGPSGTTARRIYRQDQSASANPWLFVGEIADNVTTTFTDTNSQLDNARRGRTASAIPPIVRYPYFHKNRALYLWQTGDRSKFWWSELRTPDIVLTASADYVNREDGQELTGGCTFRDRFVFFKSRSVYVLEGDGPSDWRIYPISTTIGCSHNRSIQVTPRGVIFMGQQGFWLFDGVSLKYLSDAIEPLFKNVLQGWTDGGVMEWTTQQDFTVLGSSYGSGNSLSTGVISQNFQP